VKRSRRDNNETNVSFLDVVCCGFGAIVLLLMITKTVEPIVLEQSAIKLDGQIADLQKRLFELRGETRVYNRDMNAKHEQLSLEEQRIAILRTRLAELEAREAKESRSTASDSEYQGQLEIALQSLTKEMERLFADSKVKKNDLIGGIPVDSEYIIFIIDTSGSMHQFAWSRMMDELVNILDIYPKVKGIQIMNDMGVYMFSTTRNEWIQDTPGRRKAIIERLRSWSPFSNSSPVEGIQNAIRTFYDPDKKISLYVFGDDLRTNESITDVANTIDRLNRRRRGNLDERLVRIHAVGFPVIFLELPRQAKTANRFAALMREVTHRNGGTFVGLSDYRRE